MSNVLPFPKTAEQRLIEEFATVERALNGQVRHLNDRAHAEQIARARAVLRLCAAIQIGAGIGTFWMLAARHAFILEVLAAGTLAIGAGAYVLKSAERLR